MIISARKISALLLAGLTTLAMNIRVEPPAHVGHGLRVSIDPDNGEFQRRPSVQDPVLTPQEFGLAISSLFSGSADTPSKEQPALNNDAGYVLNLENRYRPVRQPSPDQPGS